MPLQSVCAMCFLEVVRCGGGSGAEAVRAEDAPRDTVLVRLGDGLGLWVRAVVRGHCLHADCPVDSWEW